MAHIIEVGNLGELLYQQLNRQSKFNQGNNNEQHNDGMRKLPHQNEGGVCASCVP
jgi:hypothetical protein